jgi:hypothetical protein
LERMESQIKNPQYLHSIDGINVQMWLNPEEAKRPFAFVDVAEGVGKDYSVLLIVDASRKPNFEVACLYRTNTDQVPQFAEKVAEICAWYGADLLIETNSSPHLFSIINQNLGYDAMVWTMADPTDPMRLIPNMGVGSPGLRISASLKLKCANDLKTICEADTLRVNSNIILDELKRYAKDGPSYKAISGCDDTVSALLLFTFLAMSDYMDEDSARRRLVSRNQDESYVFAVSSIYDGQWEEGLDEYRKKGFLPAISGDKGLAREMRRQERKARNQTQFPTTRFEDYYHDETASQSYHGDRLIDQGMGLAMERLYGDRNVVGSDTEYEHEEGFGPHNDPWDWNAQVDQGSGAWREVMVPV